ncbi:MAG TPA: hypothetical protein VGR01_06385 [Burkholderiales bacterium]|jgi:hypothetical protein|nr:hypothetical protein [Burkholderiales bacterium]
MPRRPGTLVFIAAALLHCAAFSIGAEDIAPPGCRLAADDPLRAEVDRMIKQGAEFEQQQRLALEEKVNLLARTKGWSKRDEHEYLVAVLRGGVRETWDPTLVVTAAFMRVCEQSAGNQRAEAVRLFRELYVLDEKQWQSMHQRVDKEIASAGQEPKN